MAEVFSASANSSRVKQLSSGSSTFEGYQEREYIELPFEKDNNLEMAHSDLHGESKSSTKEKTANP